MGVGGGGLVLVVYGYGVCEWLGFEKGTLIDRCSNRSSWRKKGTHLLLTHPFPYLFTYFIFPGHTPHSQQDGELFQTCVKDSKCTEP